MPLTSDPHKEEIVEFIRLNNIRAVIPTRDGELSFWSELEETLPNVSVLVSRTPSVKACLDKLQFYREMTARGFPVILTTEHLNELGAAERVVVKERYGAGSLNILIDVSKKEAAARAAELTSPIYQPFIEGTEYSVDVYVARDGKAKGGIVRKRDLVVSGESQVSTIVDVPEVLDLGLRCCESLYLYGHGVVQVIKQGARINLLECNSRFGGGSTLSLAAGLDSFYWFLLESMNVDLAEYPFIPAAAGKRLIRFPEDLVL